MDQSFTSRERDFMEGNKQRFRHKKLSSDDLIDRGDVAVESDSAVADVWAASQKGVIDGEAEVVSGFGEKLSLDWNSFQLQGVLRWPGHPADHGRILDLLLLNGQNSVTAGFSLIHRLFVSA